MGGECGCGGVEVGERDCGRECVEGWCVGEEGGESGVDEEGGVSGEGCAWRGRMIRRRW